MAVVRSPRAAAAPPEERHFRRTPGVLASLTGLVGAPVVFLASQQIMYASVPFACGAGGTRMPMHLQALVTLLLILGCAALSAREWRRAGREWPGDEEDPRSRGRFTAATGMVLALFLSLIVLAEWLAVAMFTPCMGT